MSFMGNKWQRFNIGGSFWENSLIPGQRTHKFQSQRVLTYPDTRGESRAERYYYLQRKRREGTFFHSVCLQKPQHISSLQVQKGFVYVGDTHAMSSAH